MTTEQPHHVHALAAEDFARAADLLELEARATLLSRQEETILGWLKALPDALIQLGPCSACTAPWPWFRTTSQPPRPVCKTPNGRLALSLTGGRKMGGLLMKPNREDLAFVKELVETSKVVPVIDRRYPLTETADAICYLEGSHARGKVVITVAQNG